MSDKVEMRNEMYKSVDGERSEASPLRGKAKRRHCREIEASSMRNDIRNRCEWFVPALVTNR